MIPKIIHYCWFGKGPLPEVESRCLESWKRFCPDYKIIEWNESNFDVNLSNFTRVAYQENKYAFVADYARLYIIYNYGGIYLDTDVEIIKNIDDLLNNEAFIGTEKNGQLIAPGLGFGAIKNSKIILELLALYNNMFFENEDGVLNMTPIPCIVTPIFVAKGWKPNNTKQLIDQMTIYPQDYFGPKGYDEKINITKNTYSIHHFKGSWIDPEMRKDVKIKQKISKIFGETATIYIWYVVKIYKRKGLWHLIKRLPYLVAKIFKSR